jgi:two-component system LytT family sensor kinase
MKKWGIHILIWIAYLLIEYLANYFHYSRESQSLLWMNILFYLPAIILSTYFVNSFLVPRFLLTGKNGPFAAGILLVLLFVFFSRYYISVGLFSWAEDRTIRLPFSKITKNAIKDYAIIALATCILIINDWRGIVKKMRAVQKTNAELELALLLNKLQPHFLFNTFNNIYSLIRKDAEKGAEALLQLSSVLEYIVYLKPAEKVAIQKELDIVRHYVHLQRLKYGDQLDYREGLDQNLLSGSIPSLILLSLIENAFKHGQKINGQFILKLTIKEEAAQLLVELVNSYKGPAPQKKESRGNQNLLDRLSIFYGPKASLDYYSRDHFFITRISIPKDEVFRSDH